MKKIFLAIAFMFALFSLMACAAPTSLSSTAPRPAATGAPQFRSVEPSAPPAAGALNDSNANQPGKSQTSPSAASAERMIVYTVRLSLEVENTEKANADVTAIVTQFKGYVSATNLSRDGKGNLRGSVTVRVPAESLDAATKQIKAVGLRVLTENSNANDVTDQYSDLGAQLKNLEATETELRKLLETVRERSGKADEILAVYNRLTEIRGQIERIKGQMNVLDKTSALATLTIELTPKLEVQILEPETWAPNRTAAQALRALVQALQGLTELVIWLALFLLPLGIVLLIPLVVFVLIVRAFVKRRAKPKVVPSA
jgi:hypothetical protein